MLFLNPLMPRLFAWQAGDRRSVERLIKNTGSTPDPEGVDHYRTLVANSNHVSAALGMMANWDLQPLSRDMSLLDVPLLLIAGQNDKAIKAEDAFAIRDKAPKARVEILRGLGHLAHEEAPAEVAALMLAFARARLGWLREGEPGVHELDLAIGEVADVARDKSGAVDRSGGGDHGIAHRDRPAKRLPARFDPAIALSTVASEREDSITKDVGHKSDELFVRVDRGGGLAAS